jgi:hypothetical protein
VESLKSVLASMGLIAGAPVAKQPTGGVAAASEASRTQVAPAAGAMAPGLYNSAARFRQGGDLYADSELGRIGNGLKALVGAAPSPAEIAPEVLVPEMLPSFKRVSGLKSLTSGATPVRAPSTSGGIRG